MQDDEDIAAAVGIGKLETQPSGVGEGDPVPETPSDKDEQQASSPMDRPLYMPRLFVPNNHDDKKRDRDVGIELAPSTLSPNTTSTLHRQPSAGYDCRICLGTEHGPLYAVCNCRAGVHELCLRKW
eukprot:CAMPEP_0167810726 /NCGR_PEP_ID=MMETSP0112_2-20121227/246_1 /TAXON_ID=91324 /ORGANISM="Lotharella globosa, Strain CCCM811" /LENGTH=125 /DNA_ID=CAMNT_0007709305 /DNA_START=38 /DNA_END=412 /DNA_ORIENTATION=-